MAIKNIKKLLLASLLFVFTFTGLSVQAALLDTLVTPDAGCVDDAGGVWECLNPDDFTTSGDGPETAWAEALTGEDLTLVERDETGSHSITNGIFTAVLGSDVDYFILKLGTFCFPVDPSAKGNNSKPCPTDDQGNPLNYDPIHWLFENNGDGELLVEVDFSQYGWTGLDGSKLSHVTMFGAGDGGCQDTSCAPVPEPSSVILFGIGLIGLSVYRRRQR